jgi:hypothetical protein
MDKLILNAENISLSEEQIISASYGKIKPMAYHELSGIQTASQLFATHNYICVLYETRRNYGHWVLLSRIDDNTVEFFDPYGFRLDSELKYISDYHRKELDEFVPHLTNILKDQKIVSSTRQFQKRAEDVNTCGRHCIQRYRLRDMDLHEYSRFMFASRNDPDYLVTIAEVFC